MKHGFDSRTGYPEAEGCAELTARLFCFLEFFMPSLQGCPYERAQRVFLAQQERNRSLSRGALRILFIENFSILKFFIGALGNSRTGYETEREWRARANPRTLCFSSSLALALTLTLTDFEITHSNGERERIHERSVFSSLSLIRRNEV
jgi:hypothetical protein